MLDIKVNHIAQVSGHPVEQQDDSPSLRVKTIKNSPSMMRFKETAQFIMEMMPRKSCGEAGANQKYWLEIKDPQHRDRISLNGLDGQSGALSAWQEDANSKTGLFQWIDQHPNVEINTLKNKPKQPLSQDVGYINYLSPDQATDYRVTLSQGEWKEGGKLLDTTHLPGKTGMEGHAAIVIHRDGNIFVHPYEKGKWQHTSTTEGKPVLSAGMILIEQGKAKSFHLDSGHYMPQRPQLEHLLARLVAQGVNINELDIHAKSVAQDDISALVSKYSG
ncbi:hypothetical protein JFT91_15055 [Pseudomonas sp. TH08]|uniref:hypothetical protein n=1 Tax=unclassified Pseudomonas TaxID=196821 RepID=UPI0019117D2C|nr:MULTISPECIES: hypothetical protein [unclassified Pseudomonas]MBK5528898.1 hypothetical protein [Pseudomonas sp. TH06]MBK5533897.1 hypothetical protein [Pseudomonas sp. TH08]